MERVTDRFAEYLFSKADSINQEISQKAEACRKDYLAVVSAGAKKNEKRWTVFLEHCASGEAVVFGYSKRTDAMTAALINGFNAHCLELDDGQRFAMIHLGASAIPSDSLTMRFKPVLLWAMKRHAVRRSRCSPLIKIAVIIPQAPAVRSARLSGPHLLSGWIKRR